jgi:hypothetical protein
MTGMLEELRQLALMAVEAAVLLREVDEARGTVGPDALIARMRAEGATRPPLSALATRRLPGVVYRVDRLLHGESNCYRRTLVRVALDPRAASQPFVLGLDARKESPVGHAWIDGTERAAFDVEFRL